MTLGTKRTATKKTREDWREWKWRDEKAFIDQLGKKNKSEIRDIGNDRYFSPRSRIEQLQRYLYLCEETRDRWCKCVTKAQTIDYITESLYKACIMEDDPRRKRNAKKNLS